MCKLDTLYGELKCLKEKQMYLSDKLEKCQCADKKDKICDKLSSLIQKKSVLKSKIKKKVAKLDFE